MSSKSLARFWSHERGSTPASSMRLPAQLDDLGGVEQHRPVLEPAQLDRARERIARDRVVVVAEHDVRVRQLREQREQLVLPARTGEQVAGDRDDVRLALRDPVDGARNRAPPRDGIAEVEVREVRDAQPVELRRQAGQHDLAHAQPHPPRLEPSIRSDDRRQRDEPREPEQKGQIWSFSMTGSTETTWRLNFSSDSSSPAATPTSCDRWRIGILKSRPVAFFSFDCHASSERWQSGHGVTIASAPAS